MNTRKAIVTTAVAGAVAGAVGLGLLAVPASAGPVPVLPSVSAEQLVQSVLSTKAPALSGVVKTSNNLGLPAIPGLDNATKLLENGQGIRVWTDGQGRGRISFPSSTGEQAAVYDGTTLWNWDSNTRTVHKSTSGPQKLEDGKGQLTTNPAEAAKEMVSYVSDTSTVSVDGTAEVAGRSAYELVLTPKPNERTMLREIRIAVDSQTRIPLQLTVLANGSATPALQIGFSQLNIGAQDPGLFHFTPPAGATVTQGDAENKANGVMQQVKSTIVGKGWEAVLVTRLPQGAMSANGQQPTLKGGQDPMSLLKQFGTAVNGPWGSGYSISTSVGTALITSDGRVAVGAVPLAVLTAALGNAK